MTPFGVGSPARDPRRPALHRGTFRIRGYDADITVVDLKRRETITDRWIASRAGWTPYDGVAVTGWPVGTFVRGHKVMWQGEVVTPSRGEAVVFLESL